MRKAASVVGVVVLFVACAPSDPVTTMCDKLAGGAGCKGTDPKLCQSIARQELANAGVCKAQLEAMLECVAATDIFCTGGKARSPGDPGGTDSVTYSASGYSIEIFGKTCKDAYNAYKGCQECKDAPGYVEKKPGVGDPCGGGCATGLKCVSGFCTRTCGGDTGPCKGKHYVNGLCGGIGTKKDVWCESTGSGQICLPECETNQECKAAFPETECRSNRCRPPDCGTTRAPSMQCASMSTFQQCFSCCNTAVGATGRQDLVTAFKGCVCAGASAPCATECADLCSKSFITAECTNCAVNVTTQNAECSCGHDAACGATTACGQFDACLRACEGKP